MQFNKLKTIAAAALSVAMLFSAAACGTSDKADAGTDSAKGSDAATITSYDVSSVEKDDTIAALLPESVTKDGKLTIGTNPSYAPAEFLDADGKTQIGYDMDLARAMGNIFGLDTEIVSSNFDTIIPAIGSKYDLGIAAFTKTPERAEEIDFSDLYEKSAQLLIVKAGNADLYSTKESLAGQKVGAQKGTIQSQLIQTALPDSELFELEKYPALALEVQNGNIAGLVVDQAVGESLIATSNGGLEVSNFAFTSEEASFGKAVVAAKGSEDLLAEVNTVINQVVNDGSYLKAYDEAVELAASMGL